MSTLWTSQPVGSLAASVTLSWPAATATGPQAVNAIGRPDSRSPTVPDARVRTSVPFSAMVGPSPQRSRTGWLLLAVSGRTPGIRTPETCSGNSDGVNVSVSSSVRTGRGSSIVCVRPMKPPPMIPAGSVTCT